MDKQIPIYFDSVIVDSPLQTVSQSTPNINRLKVRVFTKYKNRNGSYITDEVADQLIQSAISGTTPVVGFFDPESQSWASHTGPLLANAYGYVENFLGWEPFTDTDGIEREYAVFSVILFTEYFEEASKIFGQNQSMELDPSSITGEWTMIEDQEFFVYKTAKMLGFCVIGEHEPCFSVSSFFSKNDDTYNSQYEKFSSLLSGLKTQVEEAEKFEKGGEQVMDNMENQETLVTEENVVAEPEVENEPAVDNFEATNEIQNENESENEDTSVVEDTVEVNPLQEAYDNLQNEYNTLMESNQQFQATNATLEAEVETLRAQNEELQTSLRNYEAQILNIENERKNNLINQYEKSLTSEEIANARAKVNDISYEQLESELAISFAHAKLAADDSEKKVLLPEQPKTAFAVMMEKYRIK